MNKREFSSPKNTLCHVWFWRRFFLISTMYFRFFVINSPWKRRALHLNKIESPSPEDAEYDRIPSLVEIGPVALENNMKM